MKPPMKQPIKQPITPLDFQHTQAEFCAWLRKPTADAPLGVERLRMQTYHELLFNNVASFIDSVYPVAASYLPAEQWQALKQQFFQHGEASSPFYYDIALHFRDYLEEGLEKGLEKNLDHTLEQTEHAVLTEYPWLRELLHYEWMELHVDIDPHVWPAESLMATEQIAIEQMATEQIEQTAQLWRLAVPVWVLAYQWPVDTWHVDTGQVDTEQVDAQQVNTAETQQNKHQFEQNPRCLLVWRNRQHQRRQKTLTPVAALLIDHLSQQGACSVAQLVDLLQQALPQLSHAQAHEWVSQVLVFLNDQDLLQAVESPPREAD